MGKTNRTAVPVFLALFAIAGFCLLLLAKSQDWSAYQTLSDVIGATLFVIVVFSLFDVLKSAIHRYPYMQKTFKKI